MDCSLRPLTILICATLPLLAQENRIAGPIGGDRRTLAGSLHPQAQTRFDQGSVEPSLKIPYITIMLKPSPAQEADLERLLEDQQDRSSPSYHRWLTPEEFGVRFSLSPADYSAIISWLESQGLHIEDRARAHNWIAFSGEARQLQTAFATQIHRYQIAGDAYIANATELSIPAALKDLVSGVRGLDDFWKADLPHYTNSAGAHLLAPDDWATIYDVAPLYSMGIDGSGQRVAIIGRSDMNQSYVNSFRSLMGLPPTSVEQHLIGPDPGITNAAGEAHLDVEWAGAIARNATIVYVYANNFNDAAQAAIDQNLAPVMSESYGTCEIGSAVGLRALAQQANAQGITWLASSGDSGGAGCDPHGFFNSTAGLVPAMLGAAVSQPASFPEVTAVGGTQFNEGGGQYWNSTNTASRGSAMSYIPEVVWNETGPGGLLASGGGASIYFPKPAWQTGPGVPNDNARDVPDVSFSAAGNHDGYMVVNAIGQIVTGGTSAGAPSFAGVVGLLNQYVVSQGIQSTPGLGNINPELYRLARTSTNVFHDITQGDNKVPCAQSSPDCSSGSIGFAAGPGYDQATGLGSIDVLNLIRQWNTQAIGTTTTLVINPGSIGLGDPVQLTATVAAASGVPSGSVTFSSGRTVLGSAALTKIGGAAMATLTVTGQVLPVGAPSVIATYSGNSAFNGSAGSSTVNVASRSAGSQVVISITPNPTHGAQLIRVTLTEVNGVGTTFTGWTINGVDDFSLFVQDFGSTTFPAYGQKSATFFSATPLNYPSNRVYVFTGTDADGRTWSQQYTLTVGGLTGTPDMSLTGIPATAQQNPAADASCQWSQQLLIHELNAIPVQLTRFLVGGADWSSRITQLFGTTLLAPLGTLQASVCWPGSSPTGAVAYELDGISQSGAPVEATFTGSLAGSATNPATLSVSKPSLTLSTTATANAAASVIGLNLTDNSQTWTASVFQARPIPWLTIVPSSGTGSQQVNVVALGSGLANGIYNATLVFQASNSIPQFIEVPVSFVVGGTSSSMSIGGVSNGASFKQAFAPGMILSVFGTQLAPSTQAASSLPLPLAMAGVSATVNGVPAPLYYVSPGQLNIQIPYETGAGPAVVGVNNNGQLASYLFTVSPSAPGIFSTLTGAKGGDVVTIFITGEGSTTPVLATGASPFFATPLALLPQPALLLAVTVGGVAADVLFAGVPPGLAGVTQINFIIPKSVPTGVQPLVVTVGGVASAALNLTVQ
jgi:uncharacterized protein (TIGR03437 family)